MDEQEFESFLYQIVDEQMVADLSGLYTFEEKGILTYNKGLVITLNDGSQFQVTIVKSR